MIDGLTPDGLAITGVEINGHMLFIESTGDYLKDVENIIQLEKALGIKNRAHVRLLPTEDKENGRQR